ncbi:MULTISPECIES: aldose epimerase family protein [Methylobacterium]|uniref:Aldose 1-epimerase n=1 Tax=Methylobacterium bullatum TaxID=570505 RepID=A0AAV4Z4M7_9HYPH|nr:MULTISPECIES: aldose epimerase family protein [Methylobacterium]MBD8904329.1 galactose-1-epimerase [Methylobacterium bullatum]TXN31813.1 galactose mutarotase [Methylobacterium sp. WL19]GJD38895.1 Aldose 1-epimerase [Methylobacterium bullatum]
MAGQAFGRTKDGSPVSRYRLARSRLRVDILDYGGVIGRIDTPDREGNWANVVLGAREVAGYEASDAHFGAIIGRYANRIAGGRFSLDGHQCQLPLNASGNTMHGGENGFDRRIWRVIRSDGTSLVLGYRSVDGEEGFPGTLDVEVAYSLSGDETLRIDYTARTDRPTIVNLTNHSYFNLSGEGSGDVMQHRIAIAAEHYLPTDAGQIPTGEIRPVAGTAFDFREPEALGTRIRDADPQLALAHGYDHTFVLRDPGRLRHAASAHDPSSGRRLAIATTQPGLQLYTANMLDGTVVGSGGRLYRAGDAVCFEAQGFPDAPNRANFPSTTLRPGEVFTATTTYRFSAD